MSWAGSKKQQKKAHESYKSQSLLQTKEKKCTVELMLYFLELSDLCLQVKFFSPPPPLPPLGGEKNRKQEMKKGNTKSNKMLQ